MLSRYYKSAIPNDMKRLIPLLLFPLFSIAQTPEPPAAAGDFTITGNITGLADSTLVFLARPGQTADMLATDYAKGGKFNLFGKIENPDIYQLSFIGYPDMPEIFLTPANL